MKRNIFISTVLVSMLSASAYAIQIQNGTLLNHKEWSTGSATGFVKEVKISNKKLAYLKQMKNNDRASRDGIMAVTRLAPTTIEVDKSSQVAGYAETYLENLTQEQQTYTVKTDVCAFAPNRMETSQCFETSNTLELNPNGFIVLGNMATLNYEFTEKDSTYITQMVTIVKKEKSSTYFGTYDMDFVDV